MKVLDKQNNSKITSKDKWFFYPNNSECIHKIFQIKYERELSSIAKLLLNSFQKKYFYHAIDDILYLLMLNSLERNNLLAILYSSAFSLQNNFSVDFFNIWIHEIYINEIPKSNKFLSLNPKKSTYITIKFICKIKETKDNKESLW